MVYQSPNNPNSHLTVKDRQWASFPTRHLFKLGLIHGRTLDFGCGKGVDVDFLKKSGVDVEGYDPHYVPTYPNGKFDTIICNYVLNVLFPEEQAHVLMAVSELLSPAGRAFFSVRRDVNKGGFRRHKIHEVMVYQCHVVLPYQSILKTEHCEIYQYQHYNRARREQNLECPFCCPDSERELVTESATVYAILDKYPVSPGHTLIIPKQHTADYFELTNHSKQACWLVADRVKDLLKQRFNPDGYNVGINIGSSAGQTIPHVHIHIIPRYQQDVPDPVGGVRNVIPGKGNYLSGLDV